MSRRTKARVSIAAEEIVAPEGNSIVNDGVPTSESRPRSGCRLRPRLGVGLTTAELGESPLVLGNEKGADLLGLGDFFREGVLRDATTGGTGHPGAFRTVMQKVF